MSQIIGIGGYSNCGKSSSLATLDPETTFIISCTPKQLTIPGFRRKYKKLEIVDGKPVGNWFFSNDFNQVTKIVKIVDKKMPHVKTLVIDDANYLLTQELMTRALEKGYDKHTELAKHYYDFIIEAMTMRDDLTMVFISHIVNDGTDIDPKYKLFTTGKLLDRSDNIDGLFNYLLYAEKIINSDDSIEYKFRTRTLGADTCRSTKGCFNDMYVDQDMQMIIDNINKFELGE